ncbi:MAG: lysophospholipid acyltransferase family protein [Acidobacteriota bacterium]|nr:lysophospholipid acyltransferase family protein [Acidobacteriota bacterium]
MKSGDKLSIRLIGLTAGLLMRFIYMCCRKRFIDTHHIREHFDSGERFIISAFHNRDLLTVFTYLKFRPKDRTVVPLISASKDGGIAAWAMRTFGITCERGSSSRGGINAFRKMVRLCRKGNDLAFTPDGPRGPKYTVQRGVIVASQLTGVPIQPVSWQAERRKELKSWDAFIVPHLFTRINVVYGKPVRVPEDCPQEDLDKYAEQLRLELLRIGEVAENFD